MKTKPETMFTIYLLHFDRPVRGSQHYLGITNQKRLETRLREHQNGYGARLTKLAALAQVPFTLAAFWDTTDPALERKLKRDSHFPRRCPICRWERNRGPELRTQWRSTPPNLKPEWTPLIAPTAISPTKKGRPATSGKPA